MQLGVADSRWVLRIAVGMVLTEDIRENRSVAADTNWARAPHFSPHRRALRVLQPWPTCAAARRAPVLRVLPACYYYDIALLLHRMAQCQCKAMRLGAACY